MSGGQTRGVPAPGSAAEPRRWSRIAPWLAPALLTVVALAQIGIAASTDLTPWKGGGFGMFSTLDGTGSRQLRITLIGPEGERRLRVRQRRALPITALRNNPGAAAAQRVADGLMPALSRPRFAEYDTLRIEVQRATYDADQARLTFRPWKSWEYPMPETVGGVGARDEGRGAAGQAPVDGEETGQDAAAD